MKREEDWFKYYNLVRDYKEKYGHTNIPANYVINGMRPGTWLARQRVTYFRPERNKLIEYRIKKLEELGIDWSVHESTWNKNYNLLKKYYEENGNTNLSKDYKIDGFNLWYWQTNQNQAYKNGILEDEKIICLNKIDNEWSIHDTKLLNREYKNSIYMKTLLKRTRYVLRDLRLEGINKINSLEEQKEIEKIIIKRIFK